MNKTDTNKEETNSLVYSYLTLRKLIGISGVLLPFVLIFLSELGTGDPLIKPSISDYYYSSNGDVFVVQLCILGIFLFTYKGYNLKETILTCIAGACAIGVAFFPTFIENPNTSSIHKPIVPLKLFGLQLHFIFAGLFFIILSLMCLYYFPKTTSGEMVKKGSQKAKRNLIYYICGGIILFSVLIIGIYFIIGLSPNEFPFVFIMESLAVLAFGISWLTKGQTFYPDSKRHS